MKKLQNVMKRFMADDRGLETVEYAIIIGLIVAGLIGVIAAIGDWVFDQFNNLLGQLT